MTDQLHVPEGFCRCPQCKGSKSFLLRDSFRSRLFGVECLTCDDFGYITPTQLHDYQREQEDAERIYNERAMEEEMDHLCSLFPVTSRR